MCIKSTFIAFFGYHLPPPQSRRRLWICFYFSHKGSAAPKKAGKPAGKGRGKPAKKDESSADKEDYHDDIQEVAVVPKLAAKKVKLVNFKLKPPLVKLSQF